MTPLSPLAITDSNSPSSRVTAISIAFAVPEVSRFAIIPVGNDRPSRGSKPCLISVKSSIPS